MPYPRHNASKITKKKKSTRQTFPSSTSTTGSTPATCQQCNILPQKDEGTAPGITHYTIHQSDINHQKETEVEPQKADNLSLFPNKILTTLCTNCNEKAKADETPSEAP